jgi:hypothetical protein
MEADAMTARRALRVVEVGEKLGPKSVTVAAAGGSRRDLLVSVRDRVAIAVEDPNTPARDLAALTRRLIEIAKDIELIDVKDAGESKSGEVTDEDFDAEAI